MKLLCGLLLIFPLPLFANAPLCLSGDLSAVWTVGIASSPEGRLLYCELHSKATDNVHGDVIYRDPQGQVIAEKKLTWQADLATPYVVQQDLRSGERIEVDGGEQWSLRYQKKHAAPLQEVRLTNDQVDVVDAGFDHKIRQHWAALLRGEKVVVNFAAPALQRSVPLRILRQNSSRCPHGDDPDWLCFWVEADNGLVRMFVDPLRLSYDAERRLRIFEGVVNIRDAAGKKQTAVIAYQYPGEW